MDEFIVLSLKESHSLTTCQFTLSVGGTWETDSQIEIANNMNSRLNWNYG